MKKNKRIITVLILIIAILLVPWIWQWPWTASDFIIAGVLLFGTAFLYELAVRKGGSRAYRAAVCSGVIAGLMLIWVNLAVGIIGNENNPANLMYFGVIAVGLVGAFIARLKPRAMVWTMLAMAIAQGLVPLIAIIIWRPEITSGVIQVIGINAFFIILFVLSASLFHRASAVEVTK